MKPSVLNGVPLVSSCPTCLRALLAYLSYVPACFLFYRASRALLALIFLCAFRAFIFLRASRGLNFLRAFYVFIFLRALLTFTL